MGGVGATRSFGVYLEGTLAMVIASTRVALDSQSTELVKKKNNAGTWGYTTKVLDWENS